QPPDRGLRAVRAHCDPAHQRDDAPGRRAPAPHAPGAGSLLNGEGQMKITSVATISLKDFPNLVWVTVETDEGLTGIGETFFGPEAVAAYVHESAAPYLLGKDPLQIELHWRELYGYYLRFRGLGAETRGASAIDVALWD